ncbi:103_t:CDS:2 [Diversispora eburnea]|uniref:103_t:CDS:1 n=1 Tax=Diversispora eburnea TaxID=1213867 RepID=A0A9N8VGZ4_9GLOM|nr:103_t:CDS:2 [Diversispora eburnea]
MDLVSEANSIFPIFRFSNLSFLLLKAIQINLEKFNVLGEDSWTQNMNAQLSNIFTSETIFGQDSNDKRFVDLLNWDQLKMEEKFQPIFDFHQFVDGLKEVELGGARCENKGIGPAYSPKASRSGVNVLMLNLVTYPFVTSSSPAVRGVITGLTFLSLKWQNKLLIIMNNDYEAGEYLQKFGDEIGTTIRRLCRCGWLDLVVLKYSIMINGYTSLNLTKLDVLDQFPELKVVTTYHLDGKPLESFPDLY